MHPFLQNQKHLCLEKHKSRRHTIKAQDQRISVAKTDSQAKDRVMWVRTLMSRKRGSNKKDNYGWSNYEKRLFWGWKRQSRSSSRWQQAVATLSQSRNILIIWSSSRSPNQLRTTGGRFCRMRTWASKRSMPSWFPKLRASRTKRSRSSIFTRGTKRKWVSSLGASKPS